MIRIKLESVVLLLLSVVVLFTGCKEDTFVSSSVQQIEFTADGGQDLLRISASGSWEATSSHEWCQLSTNSGTGDGAIRLTVDANSSLEEREAFVDIKAGSSKSRVSVLQRGLEYITLSAERAVVVNTASSISISLGATSAWEVEYDADWITKVSPNEGSGYSDVKIDFEANTHDDSRSAILTFKIKNSLVSKTFTIEQLSIHGNPRQRDSIALEAFAANCLNIDRSRVWNRDLPINRWSGVATKIVGSDIRVSELNTSYLVSSQDGGATPGIAGAHLPSELQFLTELTRLQISNFNLGGEIPAFLGKLTNLTILNLSSNLFEGNLPEELSQLKSLQVLNVSGNYLTGDLPNFIGDLTSLTDLNISINNFEKIPDNFAKLTNLTKLSMFGIGQAIYAGHMPEDQRAKLNRLRGSKLTQQFEDVERDFPVTITYLSKLESLRMHSSNFKGSIPTTISNMQSLGELVAYNNKLTGNIPSSLQYVTKLQVLNLAQNQLTGSIPEGLSALSQYLLTFIVRENNLSGDLPSDFKDLYCTFWDLSDNNFTGPVDAIFNRGWAVEVYLNNNNFSGEFPASVGAAVKIERIQASNNSFTSIPDEIINLTSLSDLRLDNNKLTAINPNIQYLSRLSILHLHNNDISGEIPAFLANINFLNTLTLSGNKLVGEVPASLINLSDKNSSSGNSWSPSPFDWSQICPQQDGFGVAYPSGYDPDNGASSDEGSLPSMGV